MRNKITYILPFFIFLSSFSMSAQQVVSIEEKETKPVENELEIVDRLIAENERHVRTQRRLKELMAEFQKQQDEFFYGNQTKKHAFLMVSTARQILDTINQEHIAHLFASQYLEELVLFSSIAGKSAPARP